LSSGNVIKLTELIFTKMRIYTLVYALSSCLIGDISIAATQNQPVSATDEPAHINTVLTAQSDTVNNLISQADIAVKNKDYRSVIRIYTKVLSIDPNLEIAYNYRGYAYNILKDHPKALADYTKVISLNPSSALAYSNRGYIYIYVKDYPKAITDFNRSIDLDPKGSFAYRGRAMALFDSNKTQAAIVDFTKAITLEPGFSDNYTRRGMAYRKLGNTQKANLDSRTAEQLDQKENTK
jgi:tetratricopeptide (TPR) repeat protein